MRARLRNLLLNPLLNPLVTGAALTAVLGLAATRADEAALKQRQQQIEGLAKGCEGHFRQPLQAELEVVRRTCGSLTADARRAIASAAAAAVPAVARRFAAWQLGEGRDKPFDGRQAIHEAVATAVKPHASPEEFAAYEREHAARFTRRERAARILILLRLDEGLDLSAPQRAAIEADLEQRWEAGWGCMLADTGHLFAGDRRPAPDFAEACIAPHLDERQLQVWRDWCAEAGWSRRFAANVFVVPFDGQVLPPDPWWTP